MSDRPWEIMNGVVGDPRNGAYNLGKTYQTEPDASATVLEVKNVKGFDLISVSGPDTEEEAKEATPQGFELKSFVEGHSLYGKIKP